MTVKDSGESAASWHMAKRQKTDNIAPDIQEPGGMTDDTPSKRMICVIEAATRTPDMNIVDFSDDISDFEITPGSEPHSDSDVPPRLEKVKKKKKKHTKGHHSKKHLADAENSQKKDEQCDSTKTDAKAKS